MTTVNSSLSRTSWLTIPRVMYGYVLQRITAWKFKRKMCNRALIFSLVGYYHMDGEYNKDEFSHIYIGLRHLTFNSPAVTSNWLWACHTGIGVATRSSWLQQGYRRVVCYVCTYIRTYVEK